MNKRIKKKNSEARVNAMIIKAIDLIGEYELVYARLVGRKNLPNVNDDFWNGYFNWNKSITGHRTWNYILRINNLPNYIGYKSKTIKTYKKESE